MVQIKSLRRVDSCSYIHMGVEIKVCKKQSDVALLLNRNLCKWSLDQGLDNLMHLLLIFDAL